MPWPSSSPPISDTANLERFFEILTIVFADLVGSTALHERLDAESARRFMERYYAAMRGAVESQGGTVTQLLGDGVKAGFGLPRVAADDAAAPPSSVVRAARRSRRSERSSAVSLPPYTTGLSRREKLRSGIGRCS